MTEPRSRLSVVLVDDNQSLLESTARYLESRGIQVTTSNTALGVGVLVLKQRPDAVVLDVMMPALNGNMLAKMIRSRSATPSIILYSAMPEEELYRLAREVPGTTYVLKSDGVEELHQALLRLVAAPHA
jgi:two-component system response regulator MprA